MEFTCLISEWAHRMACGKKNTGGSHQAAAYDQRDTFPSTLGFPRRGKKTVALCRFSQGLSMTYTFTSKG